MSNGTPNVCSKLYATCSRVAKEMGYRKIQTYVLETESGTSLKGAGWILEKTDCGGTPQGKRTDRPNGHRTTAVSLTKKHRWAKALNDLQNIRSANAA